MYREARNHFLSLTKYIFINMPLLRIRWISYKGKNKKYPSMLRWYIELIEIDNSKKRALTWYSSLKNYGSVTTTLLLSFPLIFLALIAIFIYNNTRYINISLLKSSFKYAV